MSRNNIFLLFAAGAAIAVMIITAGCSTPQERAGVSPIPFGAHEQSDTRSFGGSL